MISKCLSHNIRRKLLEKGKTLTLLQLREIARVMEDSEKQARKIEGAANKVNRVSVNSNEKGNPRVAGKQGTVRCFCCGIVGHNASDKVCPARGKRCRKCSNAGHFKKVCKTKLKASEGKGGKDRRIRQVGVGVDGNDDSEYAFGVLGVAGNPDNGEEGFQAGKKLYSYGSRQPLQVAGTSTADVLVGSRMLNEVEFDVLFWGGRQLLRKVC